MNDKIITFLKSDLLEKYIVGNTTPTETKMVEAYISKYKDVQNAYNTLQDNLEIVAKSNAVKAPKRVLNTIMNEIDNQGVIKLSTHKRRKYWYKLSIAASIAAFIFAGTSLFFFMQNQKLSHENRDIVDENNTIVDEIFDLRSDIDSNNSKLDKIFAQLQLLNNPETHKYIINGNSRAKDLKTVAYINPIDKTSLIDVVKLPQLPEEQCYQIWAEVQDRMVSLGILNQTNWQLKPIPYTENALGLSITIEPKGGNKNATIENSVAEIRFLKNN